MRFCRLDASGDECSARAMVVRFDAHGREREPARRCGLRCLVDKDWSDIITILVMMAGMAATRRRCAFELDIFDCMCECDIEKGKK
jgi:hypothetical protein